MRTYTYIASSANLRKYKIKKKYKKSFMLGLRNSWVCLFLVAQLSQMGRRLLAEFGPGCRFAGHAAGPSDKPGWPLDLHWKEIPGRPRCSAAHRAL